MTFRPVYAVYAWILGLTAVGVFLVSVAHQGSMETSQTEAVAFVTVSLDQSKLLNESSSYEVQRAAEHFSDVLLGWTVEPSFAVEFAHAVGAEYSFSGRRQEKENLLFEVSGPVTSVDPAKALVGLLKGRLTEYNSATHSGYVIAFERESLVSKAVSNWRFDLGVTFLVLLIEGLLLLTWDYAYARRH